MAEQSSWMGFLPFVLIIAVFWFLVIAPQRKREKARQQMIEALKPGDKIITNGGIYGTVAGVGEQVIQLRVAEKIKIEVAKNAIAGKQNEPS